LKIAGDKWTELFDLDDVSGAMIHQEFRGMPCTYAISSRSRRDDEKKEGNIDVVGVTRMLNFDPLGDGAVLWQKLQNDGKLYERKEPRASGKTSKYRNKSCS
jgi:hypothetical protein